MIFATRGVVEHRPPPIFPTDRADVVTSAAILQAVLGEHAADRISRHDRVEIIRANKLENAPAYQLKLQFRLVAALNILSRKVRKERETIAVATIPNRALRLRERREKVEVAPYPLGRFLGHVVDESLFLAGTAMPHRDRAGSAAVQSTKNRQLVRPRREVMGQLDRGHNSPTARSAARRPRR